MAGDGVVAQDRKDLLILNHHPVRPFSPNGQFLLARLRRAFLQDSPTPGGSLRFAHRGL